MLIRMLHFYDAFIASYTMLYTKFTFSLFQQLTQVELLSFVSEANILLLNMELELSFTVGKF